MSPPAFLYPVALLLATSALLAAASAAPQESWEDHARAGESALAAGDTARAELELRRALELTSATGAPGPPLEASLANLARLYELTGRLDQAQPLYELTLVATEHRTGPAHGDLLAPLAAAGRVALRAGDVPAAGAHLKRYVEVADATGAADPTELWQVLGLLSRMGALQQKAEDALLFQRRAVAVMDDDRFTDPDQRVEMLAELAMMELRHGSTAAAESFLDRLVGLCRDADNPGAAVVALAEGAEVALATGHTELAERLVERVIAIEARPDVLITARKVLAQAAWQRVPRGGNLATWLAAPADSVELAHAEERLRSLLAVQRLALPPDHEELTESLSRLVEVSARRGDLSAAVESQRLLVQNRLPAGGDTLVAALSDLVTLELEAGRVSQAAFANADLIRTLDALARGDDPRLRPALQLQQRLLKQLGRSKEAKAIRQRLKRR